MLRWEAEQSAPKRYSHLTKTINPPRQVGDEVAVRQEAVGLAGKVHVPAAVPGSGKLAPVVF